MAKSNPIGVRFDLDKLELIKKQQKLSSPQSVLNYLMDNLECISKSDHAKKYSTGNNQYKKCK